MPADISGLPASLAPSLGNTKKKENPENVLLCCSLGPKVDSQSAFSLPFRVLLCLFYLSWFMEEPRFCHLLSFYRWA